MGARQQGAEAFHTLGASRGCETTQNGVGVDTEHGGVGDKSSCPAFRDPAVLIPKILNRLEEERNLAFSCLAAGLSADGLPVCPSDCLHPPRRDRSHTLRSSRSSLRGPGLRKMKEWVRSCLGAPLPHNGLPGPLEVAAARGIATQCPCTSNYFCLSLSLKFFSFFLFLFEGTDRVRENTLNGEIDIKIPGSVNKVNERK